MLVGHRPRGGGGTGGGLDGRPGRDRSPVPLRGGDRVSRGRGRPHRRLARTAGGRRGAAPPYLLALGGSASVGFQPTAAHPRGQPTGSGYAEDLVPLEQRRWPGLDGRAPGLSGRHHGHHARRRRALPLPGGNPARRGGGVPAGSPLDRARHRRSGVQRPAALLAARVRRCGVRDGALTTVHDQLGQILARLKAAAPSGAVVVGVGHYDPYLGDYVRGTGAQAFSAATLGVMERLDETLQSDYRSAGMPMAEVGAAFDLTDQDPVTRPGLGTVPTDVARTCALTWMCDPPPFGHNPHPDDAGYRTIAGAIADAVADSSAKADADPDRSRRSRRAARGGRSARLPSPRWSDAMGPGSGRSGAWPAASGPAIQSARCRPGRRSPP